MAHLVERSHRFLWVPVFALALGIMSCGSGGSSSNTVGNPALQRPGACVCYDGSFNFRSCSVKPDYQTCLSEVTTCNPTFYTNTDCSYWCPESPQGCVR